MAEWYAGAVIYRKKGNVTEYLVIDTKSLHPAFKGRSKVQTKFIGGTEEGHRMEDKNILGTLRRELTEETDMSLPDGWNPPVIHSENLPGHFKNFYLIPFEVLRGTLRKGDNEIDLDWMSEPQWKDRHFLAHALYPSHQAAFMKALARVDRAA